MSKYSGFDNQALFETYRKKQKHLIIPNILIIIMALVTIICSVCMPMIKMTITLNGDNLTEIVDTFLGEETSSDDSSDETTEALKDAIKDLDLDFTIALYPLDVIKVAANGDNALVLFSNMLDDINELVDDIVQTMIIALTEILTDTLIELLSDETEIFVEVPDGATEALEDTFNSLFEGDTDKAKEYLSEFMDILVDETGLEISEDTAQEKYLEICDIIDDSVNEDGNFRYTLFLSSLIEYTMGADSEEYAEMQDLLEQLNDLDAEAIADSIFAIDEQSSDMIVKAALAVVLATVGLCILVWAILFLFALLHTLSKNRRFVTWYVKLFAWIPSVLFYLIPTVALTLITKLADLGDMQGVLDAVKNSVSFGGSGIVSGICYILLWLVSIFWLFPIKHGIRACKKQLKARGVTKQELKG